MKLLILALRPSRILITFKNSLDLLITVENSLEILRTSRGLSYIPLMMWSLRRFLLDPHLCGFRFLDLLTRVVPAPDGILISILMY